LDIDREWKKMEFLKKILYMNLETARLKGRPRNRWQDEVREGGRLVGGEGLQEKIYNRKEWKKLLTTARNRCILHKLRGRMPFKIKQIMYSFRVSPLTHTKTHTHTHTHPHTHTPPQ
jgi:hypothetical protein